MTDKCDIRKIIDLYKKGCRQQGCEVVCGENPESLMIRLMNLRNRKEKYLLAKKYVNKLSEQLSIKCQVAKVACRNPTE